LITAANALRIERRAPLADAIWRHSSISFAATDARSISAFYRSMDEGDRIMSTIIRLSAVVLALVVGPLTVDAAVAKEKRCRQVCEERTEYEPPPCEHRTSYVRRIVERRTVYVAQPEVVATPVIAYPAYSYGYAYPYGYGAGYYGAGYGVVGASYGGWGWGW
jgi:hypothetical protein